MRVSSRSRLPLFLAAAILPCWVGDDTLLAQRGDREGHEMSPPPAEWKIPAAPVLTADKELKTFAVPDGFSVELVAAEPYVHDPVALAFDGNGRIWVAEMRGYMPDPDGHGEDEPVGRISVLEDTDDDGVADRHTVFLDQLVMPRAVALTANDTSLLWADNEKLYEVAIIESENGGPKAGEQEVIDEDYAEGGNPEHKPNGLRMALDNWIYSAKCDKRYRRIAGEWVEEKTEFRGQWGIDQDDQGRIFTNTNSNFVTAEEIAPGLTERNPNHEFRARTSTRLSDQRVWASRMSPGINRGYMDSMLDENGFLKGPTAVSGLTVYRGDQFPEDYYGNLFINEPGGNLVKRALIEEKDGRFTITQAYEGRDFFTSTDERSRIVNCYTAPDGTLYLIDFYRGILQHAAYMTTFLRRQVDERGLDKPVGLGRIWRVVHDGKPRDKAPRMHDEGSEALVAHLSHPNAWWRETAQRLLVERGDKSVVSGLRKLAGSDDADPRARIHAIWTLEGLGALAAEDVATAFAAAPEIGAQALRASEKLADTTQAGAVISACEGVLAKGSPAPVLRRQLLASLGTFASASEDQKTRDAAYALMRETLATPAEGDEAKLGEDLAISGLARQEATFLADVLAHQPDLGIASPLSSAIVKTNDSEAIAALQKQALSLDEPFRSQIVRELAVSAAKFRRPILADSLLAAAAADEALQKPVIDGLLAGRKAVGKKFKPIALKTTPALLADSGGYRDDKKRLELATVFDFSGKEDEVFLKTEADLAQFELGKKHYAVICAACHQPHGKGLQALAPPLVDSEWVMGPPTRLIALTMEGVMGPIEVDGKVYQMPDIQPLMPGMRINPEIDDEKLASMLTYVRNEWGNGASPITPEMVKQWREKQEVRAPFTPEELLKIE
ncbi:MAG: hypothetical protein KDN19_12440 [Verrucomicrobiae bacterium]|nr:hypothetical protein [Verrucomicrobiae bacterium]